MKARCFKQFIILATLLMGTQVSQAQDQNAATPTRALSLEEATRIALDNNFDIQLTKYDAWIARTDKQVAGSIYDTILEAEVEYRDNRRKRTSTILGTREVDNDYNVGVSKKLPTGTTIGVDLENNRNFNNATFATSPLTHDSTLGATVEQDLGKNIFGIQDRGSIKITLKDIEQAEYTSFEKIEASVADVQKAYWDLVLEMENEKIEEGMVAEAKKLYDLHQEKLKDGLVEVVEAIATEANYESRKNTLTLVRNEVQSRNNVLKLLLNIEENIAIHPSENFGLPDTQENLGEALKKAFENRPDYQKAKSEIEAKDIQLSMNKNNLWPEINLTATFERNGLGDHFKQAVTQVTDERNANFFAGLEITFPLENNEARGELKAAELEKAKALVALKLLEREISVNVADQVRNCNIFLNIAANSEGIARLQEKKLKEEQKRFRYGRSDTDTIIRFQEDADEAERDVVTAIHRYYTAVIDLRQKEGTLLKSYWEGEL